MYMNIQRYNKIEHKTRKGSKLRSFCSRQGSNTHLPIQLNRPGYNMDEAMLILETRQNIINFSRNTSFY